LTNAYKKSKDGTPIPNPTYEGRREQMKMTTTDIYLSSCALLRDILQLQYQLEPEDFSNPEDYATALARCHKAFEITNELYLWASPIHIGVGWPDCDSNMITPCGTSVDQASN